MNRGFNLQMQKVNVDVFRTFVTEQSCFNPLNEKGKKSLHKQHGDFEKMKPKVQNDLTITGVNLLQVQNGPIVKFALGFSVTY